MYTPTVPLRSKLPVSSRFSRDESRASRYEILVSRDETLVSRYENRVSRESLKRKFCNNYNLSKVSREKKNTCIVMRLSVPFLKRPVPIVDDSVVHACSHRMS